MCAASDPLMPCEGLVAAGRMQFLRGSNCGCNAATAADKLASFRKQSLFVSLCGCLTAGLAHNPGLFDFGHLIRGTYPLLIRPRVSCDSDFVAGIPSLT